jgi:hypothetical protein
MKTIQLTSRINEYGILRLQIPTDMPAQEVEILVVMQPMTRNREILQDSGWPPEFFEKTAGIFQDEPLERAEHGEYEIREVLK